jgi:hypothetical protein
MQEPERPGETRRIDAERTDNGYATRVRAALAGFLALTDTQRRAVVAGVTEDNVPYRGDGFDEYMAIYHETEQMRAIGVEMYRAMAMLALNALRER